MHRTKVDSTVFLLAEGYTWAPGLLRRAGTDAVRTRLTGRPAVLIHGREAVRFFYDEQHVLRRGALPGPVLDTLFGRGAVHGLDGSEHRARKRLFASLLMSAEGVAALTGRFEAAWADAVPGWAGRRVVLFDEVGTVLARAVCDWVGLPVPDDAAREIAEDCIAMVDGFATPGSRHWRARHARRRQEEALARAVLDVRGAGPHADGPFAPSRHHGVDRSALAAVARHREADGTLLPPHTAAVELLNIVRPTVALAWYTAFAAHALHRDPAQRDRLRTAGFPYARAFAHELRRFYPFVPFVGGLAARDLRFGDVDIPAESLVLLDVYGHHHDPELWERPNRFDPGRFLGHEPDPAALIPQGAGDARTGHRCPGEDITLALLTAIAQTLAHLDFGVPQQDLSIPLHRIPTRPRSGFVMDDPRPSRSHAGRIAAR
ncbi:cytochrome P450 [Streptomyces sp. NPDC089799]|uniref:cytochrome P450 n=1 Tax=Streptomyces sp. NPDC089799 TaxID=3155066 RepID=UPI003428B219